MIDALPLLLGPEGYQISRSVRLRSSASAFFNRTPASAGSRTTWTFSAWIKRGALGGTYRILQAATTATPTTNDQYFGFLFNSSDQLACGLQTINPFVTSQVFRDPSAWYHIVLVADTTNATATNRIQLYINGSRVTAFASSDTITQNQNLALNSTSSQTAIGREILTGTSGPFDGYLTEINFIDGQALTPSSFGETNAVTSVWQPKKYAGTYGTNGFFLNFSDNSAATAAAIGKDYSGNGNNWTPNNISVTAGVTYDSMLDVPTQWADGGNGRGNYATLNPVGYSFYATRPTLSNGNLNFSDSSTSNTGIGGTIAVTSGKWYFEVLCTSTGIYAVGLKNPDNNTQYSFYRTNGAYSSTFGGAGTSGYSTWTNNDVIGVAWDADTGKIWFAKNNVWQAGDPAAGTSPTNTYTPGIPLTADMFTDNTAGTKSGAFNFGQRPFAYTPPSGFKALNTLNLPTPTILKGNQYFDVSTWTGNGSNPRAVVTGLAFQPDLVWAKTRNQVRNHVLFDSARGAGSTKGLFSNNTDAEGGGSGNETSNYGYVTAFNSDGFSVTNGAINNNYFNANTDTYVGWQWKEGATQGFDIVTYTGNGAARTISHNLGVAPAMMIIKDRSAAGDNWIVWHKAFVTAGTSDYVLLNSTLAKGGGGAVDNWNNTPPTSSVFSLGTFGAVNRNADTYVAYLFAEVAGFSRFGSYTGNGSADGPMVFTGFRPAFVLIKQSSASGQSWQIQDSTREPYNDGNRTVLFPDLSNAEITDANPLDFLSNGFKIRNAGNGNNASGATYIYAAFAANPFKNALAF